MDPTDTIAAAGHRLQVRRTQPNRQQCFLDVFLRRQKVNADRLVLSMRYVCCYRKGLIRLAVCLDTQCVKRGWFDEVR